MVCSFRAAPDTDLEGTRKAFSARRSRGDAHVEIDDHAILQGAKGCGEVGVEGILATGTRNHKATIRVLSHELLHSPRRFDGHGEGALRILDVDFNWNVGKIVVNLARLVGFARWSANGIVGIQEAVVDQ